MTGGTKGLMCKWTFSVGRFLRIEHYASPGGCGYNDALLGTLCHSLCGVELNPCCSDVVCNSCYGFLWTVVTFWWQGMVSFSVYGQDPQCFSITMSKQRFCLMSLNNTYNCGVACTIFRLWGCCYFTVNMYVGLSTIGMEYDFCGL